MENRPHIPVTIFTGFLGAGKTTLLNRVLRENHGKKIAVIENEFGEVGVDNELVLNADEEFFEMNNGCICCTVRGDLIRILHKLLTREQPVEHVIIETTGLANPAPVAQTFWLDETLLHRYRLDAIVTVVDARHFWLHVDENEQCKEQVAFADVVLINKADLANAAEIDRIERRVKSMNIAATLYRTQNAEIDLDKILNIHAFDLSAKTQLHPDFAAEEFPFEYMGIYALNAGEHRIKLSKGPDATIDILLVRLEAYSDEQITRAKNTAVRKFAETPTCFQGGETIGFAANLCRLAAQDNSQTFHFSIAADGTYALFTEHTPAEFDMQVVRTETQQNMTPLESYELGHSHEHDELVSSVGIENETPVDEQKMEFWLGYLASTKGQDIYRMKGILHIAGRDERYVFQGVHMILGCRAERLWHPGEKRRNQMVFIGKNLNRQELLADFALCLSAPKAATRSA